MRPKMGKKCYRLVTGFFSIGWMAVIFWFSALPAAESSRQSGSLAHWLAQVIRPQASDTQLTQLAIWLDYPIRKAAHMTEYAILGLLLFFFVRGWLLANWQSYAGAFVLAVCYAVTDEVHQIFVPGRSGQASDVCIDAVGILSGLFVIFLLQKIKALRKQKASSTIKLKERKRKR